MLTLTAEITGDFPGDIVLQSNDPDTTRFAFAVDGKVTSTRIIDDSDAAGFTLSGTSTAYSHGFNDQERITSLSATGAATATATWTFTDLIPGDYRVSATWEIAGGSASQTAPFAVYDGAPTAGLPLASVTLDQQQNPDDFSDKGAFWEDLQSEPLTISGNTLTVVLTNATDRPVIVDAIRVERLLPNAALSN